MRDVMAIIWVAVSVWVMSLAMGCATPHNTTGVMVRDGMIGAQVDLAEVREKTLAGLWRTYISAWVNHPYFTAAGHIAAFGGGYLVGERQGWWGSKSGRRNSHGNDSAVQIYMGDYNSSISIIVQTPSEGGIATDPTINTGMMGE